MTETRKWHSGMTTLTAPAYDDLFFEKLGEGPFPLTGQWELTYRCNLKCVMCYTDPFNTPERIKQELTYEEIIRILDELYEAGCFYLCFTGGDPFARRDFLDIYTHAKKKGFLLTLFTNGTYFTPKIADTLKAYPPLMIEISFHGLTKDSFEQITQGRGSFNRCLEGIRLLLERNLPVMLKTVGMTVNRDEVLKIKDFVNRLGNVQYKFGSDIRERLDDTEDVYKYQLPENEIRAIEQADPAFRAERDKQNRCQEEMVRQEKKALCGGGKYKFHIDAYGQLQLCSNNRSASYDLRKGSFKHGFYEVLPTFPCPRRPSLFQISLPQEKRERGEAVKATTKESCAC